MGLRCGGDIIRFVSLLVFFWLRDSAKKCHQKSVNSHLTGKSAARRPVGWEYWRFSASRSASDIVSASNIFAAGLDLALPKSLNALATSEPGQIDLMTLFTPLRKPPFSVASATPSLSAVSFSVSSLAWTRTARRAWRLVDLGRVSAAREVRVVDESVTATMLAGLANGKGAIRSTSEMEEKVIRTRYFRRENCK